MTVLTINEIFHSIQGESTYAGRPCVFVRLTACDLRCRWCDTPYAFHEGRKMSVDDVLADVLGRDCPLVEVTGGEPLLRKDIFEIAKYAADRDFLAWLQPTGRRLHVLLTKADKLSAQAAHRALTQTRRGLDEVYPGATAQLFSALRKLLDCALNQNRALDRQEFCQLIRRGASPSDFGSS